MRRSLAIAATLLATGTVLSACGSSAPPQASGTSTTTSSAPRSTTTTTELALGQEAPGSEVPWRAVGPGWTVAEWGPAAGMGPGNQPPAGQPSQSDETVTLYLVNPVGGRYAITTFPSSNSLSAWSPDGTRVLLLDSGSTSSGIHVSELDLKTGQQHSFTVQGEGAVSYTEPDGQAVLATDTTSNPSTLRRYSLTGTLQETYPTTFASVGAFTGSSLETPDGTEIAMGAHSGLGLVSNSGAVVRTLPVPGASTCFPARWWTPGVLLAGCIDSVSEFERLWLIPIAGGAPTALTDAVSAGAQSPDAGDEDAWALGSGTYLQDAGGCGYQYLAQLNPTTHLTSPITVPDVVGGDSQFVLGAAGDQLALLATVSCGGGVSLLWYRPSTNTSTVVLGPGVNAGGVTGAILFGDNNGQSF